jgi:hypothetical protein
MKVAHFDRAVDARACLSELRRGTMFRPSLHIVVRPTDKKQSELPITFTDVKRAAWRGIAVGAVGGLFAAFLVGIVGYRWWHLDLALLPYCGFLGLVLGAFGGALSGGMNPDPELERVMKQGGVTVAVETKDEADLAWAVAVLRKWHAVVTTSSSATALSPAG